MKIRYQGLHMPEQSEREMLLFLGMLFIGHTGATSVNAGKVYFTKNPLAINYPQWMDFAKYSYKQLRWAVIQKPAMRDAYVEEVLNSELKVISEETDALFEEFCVGRFVVFE